MTSDRRRILVENENRVDVNIWRWLNIGFRLHNLKTTKSQRQLTSVLDINLTLTLDIEFWSPDVATEILTNINVLWRCVPLVYLLGSFRLIWKLNVVCVGAGLEQNSAGLRPSRNWVWHPWHRLTSYANMDSAKIKVPIYTTDIDILCIDASYRQTCWHHWHSQTWTVAVMTDLFQNQLLSK